MSRPAEQYLGSGEEELELLRLFIFASGLHSLRRIVLKIIV
jgi:hypothetical protein